MSYGQRNRPFLHENLSLRQLRGKTTVHINTACLGGVRSNAARFGAALGSWGAYESYSWNLAPPSLQPASPPARSTDDARAAPGPALQTPELVICSQCVRGRRTDSLSQSVICIPRGLSYTGRGAFRDRLG